MILILPEVINQNRIINKIKRINKICCIKLIKLISSNVLVIIFFRQFLCKIVNRIRLVTCTRFSKTDQILNSSEGKKG